MAKQLIAHGALAIFSLGVIAPTQAQQAPATDAAARAAARQRAGSTSDRIDKVEITATRAINAVDVQQVPAAITAQ